MMKKNEAKKEKKNFFDRIIDTLFTEVDEVTPEPVKVERTSEESKNVVNILEGVKSSFEKMSLDLNCETPTEAPNLVKNTKTEKVQPKAPDTKIVLSAEVISPIYGVIGGERVAVEKVYQKPSIIEENIEEDIVISPIYGTIKPVKKVVQNPKPEPIINHYQTKVNVDEPVFNPVNTINQFTTPNFEHKTEFQVSRSIYENDDYDDVYQTPIPQKVEPPFIPQPILDPVTPTTNDIFVESDEEVEASEMARTKKLRRRRNYEAEIQMHSDSLFSDFDANFSTKELDRVVGFDADVDEKVSIPTNDTLDGE